MPKAQSFRILLGFITLGIFWPQLAARSVEPDFIKVTLEPVFPAHLANAGVTEGYAEFLIVVDNQGTLRDHLLTEASHPSFGAEVDDVIRQWDFYPAVVDGRRINAMHRVRVDFHNKGTFVVGLNTPTQIIMGRDLNTFGSRDASNYHIATLRHLDRMPQAVQQVSPALPFPEMIPPEGLRIVYRFFIDQEGRVRIPWLDEEQVQHIDESILDATYDALMQWRFTPPTINGEKVVTEASQPFWFNSEQASLVDVDS